MTEQDYLREAIAHLEGIPDDQWCVGDYYLPTGEACALGHLYRWSALNEGRSHWYRSLRVCQLVAVNDNAGGNYHQGTPKARVLAYLNDLLAEDDRGR